MRSQGVFLRCSSVVLGHKQLGIRLSHSDACYELPARTWSLRWLPKMATRTDANILLFSMGFVETDMVDKFTCRQGSAWAFRAKREDGLEIVQRCCDAGDGVVDVQAIF